MSGSEMQLWFAAVVCGVATSGIAGALAAPQIDPSTLRHKVLCGYQGWFRCPGDGTGDGWRHWSREPRRIAPETLTFEMWPDISELDADERFEASGFHDADGRPAQLFSSAHPKTVMRHFEWMREHGIDGVFLQRFLVNVDVPSFDRVLEHVRAAAAKTGRVYAICYDMTGYPSGQVVETLQRDWRRLSDELKITRDNGYLRHQGKPLVFVWGFFPDRFGADVAHRVIDVFKGEGAPGVTLIGGCPWYWRQEKNPEWAGALRRFDVISPWNVGNAMRVGDEMHAATVTWSDDMEEARRAGMEYLPVIYPGFGWTNLMGEKAASQTLPRLGGRFFWRQFVTARELGVQMAYVAMFDEVDEATAIFKVTNAPPREGRFATYDGAPPDWYLRLTGEGSKLIRRERIDTTMPQADVAR